MDKLELHDWTLRVDPRATASFYETRTPLACDCGHCRNFIAAFPMVDDHVRAVFGKLGIDPRREGGEVFEMGRNEDGSLQYMGVMVLVGDILDAPEDYAVTLGSTTQFNPSEFASGLSGGFVQEDSLVALCVPDQPDPHIVFQFNLSSVPWVLDEDPSGES